MIIKIKGCDRAVVKKATDSGTVFLCERSLRSNYGWKPSCGEKFRKTY